MGFYGFWSALFFKSKKLTTTETRGYGEGQKQNQKKDKKTIIALRFFAFLRASVFPW